MTDPIIKKTLIRAELAKQLSKSGFGSPRQANDLIEALLSRLSHALNTGSAVNLKGFGHFEVVTTAARTGRNPKTGEPIAIPAGRRVRFKPSKQLLKEGEA